MTSLESRFGDLGPIILEHGFAAVPNLLIWRQAELGLTPQELVLILNIYSLRGKRIDHITLGILSKHMGIGRPGILKTVRKLEEKGFLKRTMKSINKNNVVTEGWGYGKAWEKLAQNLKENPFTHYPDGTKVHKDFLVDHE